MINTNSTAPHIYKASTIDDLVDWGVQPDAVVEGSHSSGRLLYKGPNNQPESGLWVCTPGTWKLSLPRDEFCHFVSGQARYTSDEGEVIEVSAGSCVLFPENWSGTCEVIQTLRNLYMIV